MLQNLITNDPYLLPVTLIFVGALAIIASVVVIVRGILMGSIIHILIDLATVAIGSVVMVALCLAFVCGLHMIPQILAHSRK